MINTTDNECYTTSHNGNIMFGCIHTLNISKRKIYNKGRVTGLGECHVFRIISTKVKSKDDSIRSLDLTEVTIEFPKPYGNFLIQRVWPTCIYIIFV